MHPEIYFFYLAVRSGVRCLDLSGNGIHPEHCASIILGTVITTAEFEPTPPLPLS